MIALSPESIQARALAVVGQLDAATVAEVVPGRSVIGGGSTPEQSIPTWLISIIVARIENDRLLLDLRTVDPEEDPELIAGLRRHLVAC
jgi:L-seryl-tRNA(Ser) seleniumtransferase